MPGNLKTVILDFCLCKTEAGKSYHDYRNIIVFEKRLLEMLSAKPVFSNSSSLKNVWRTFERLKNDGLVWTEGLNGEI